MLQLEFELLDLKTCEMPHASTDTRIHMHARIYSYIAKWLLAHTHTPTRIGASIAQNIWLVLSVVHCACVSYTKAKRSPFICMHLCIYECIIVCIKHRITVTVWGKRIFFHHSVCNGFYAHRTHLRRAA